MSPVWYLLIANLVCLSAAWFAKETRPVLPGTPARETRLTEAPVR